MQWVEEPYYVSMYVVGNEEKGSQQGSKNIRNCPIHGIEHCRPHPKSQSSSNNSPPLIALCVVYLLVIIAI